MKRFAMVMMCVLTFGAGAAQAADNVGFEDGNLTGWSAVGSVAVVSSYDSYNAPTYFAPDGNYFARIITSGCNLNSVERTFYLEAGESLAGYAAFDAGDYMPYNDYAVLRIQVFGAWNQLFYSNVRYVGDYGYTPWTSWDFVAPAAGNYTLYFGAENVGDCGVNSVAHIDLIEELCEDADSDGVCEDVDNCPGLYNADQLNSDGDEYGDACDECPFDAENDIDADDICGDVDNCPYDANTDQADNDADELGDLCDDDDDNDGVLDDDDNCQFDANADQADAEGDGFGDVCDDDDDNDAVLDTGDACPGTALEALVDVDGCSIDQYCPCDLGWKSHGKYVSCVAHAANDFVEAGLIDGEEHGVIVSEAAQSECGAKSKGK